MVFRDALNVNNMDMPDADVTVLHSNALLFPAWQVV